MKRVSGGWVYLTVGVIIGLISAVAAVDSIGASAVRPGSIWQSWDTSPTARLHPYAIAHYLLGGRLPPAAGQMRELAAERDRDGGVISSGCTYTVTGRPGARAWWSLAASAGGSSAPSIAGMLTSDNAILDSDGSLTVTVSRAPQPGNWIRPPERSNFVLLFMVAGETGLSQRDQLPDLLVKRSSC